MHQVWALATVQAVFLYLMTCGGCRGDAYHRRSANRRKIDKLTFVPHLSQNVTVTAGYRFRAVAPQRLRVHLDQAPVEVLKGLQRPLLIVHPLQVGGLRHDIDVGQLGDPVPCWTSSR